MGRARQVVAVLRASPGRGWHGARHATPASVVLHIALHLARGFEEKIENTAGLDAPRPTGTGKKPEKFWFRIKALSVSTRTRRLI
jgi:hypothetical protein